MSSNHSTDHVSGGGERGGERGGECGGECGGKRGGLRSALAARCRVALKDVGSDESRKHIAECSFCMARAKAVESLAEFASQRPDVQRPDVSAALSAASMLEGIYKRVAESAQHVSLGEWLQQSPVPTPEVATDASPWADATSGVERANDDLVGEFLRGPELPDARVWSGVRRSILADVAHESVTHETATHETATHEIGAPSKLKLKLTDWRVLLAGAAASAVIGLLAVSDPAPVHPTIVFADLDRAPDVEFATVRYGSRH